MIAGVPGTGVGGLFYLLSALWMPFEELILTLCGRSNAKRWYVVGMQFGIAIVIILGIWFTGWLFGLRHPDLLQIHVKVAGHPGTPLYLVPILVGLAFLGGILLSVQVLRLVVGRGTPHGETGSGAYPLMEKPVPLSVCERPLTPQERRVSQEGRPWSRGTRKRSHELEGSHH